MSTSGIAARQVVFEQKSFWRNPASAFFAFLFPIIFLVVFATLFKGQHVQIGTVSTTYDNYYIPALVAFGVMGACFTNIAVTLALRRDMLRFCVRVLGVEGRGNRRTGRTPRLALEHDKAPRDELAVIGHPRGDGQKRIDLGRGWTGAGKLDRFEGAPGGEEF